ncbi:hypothetical protein ACFWO6_30600 [Paenibacillus glucanolyticus]|uniref:hypothetical protein n=1 Tax=Paenibacillus glucanolyticus TaxID=59843 RepID=UPI003647414B
MTSNTAQPAATPARRLISAGPAGAAISTPAGRVATAWESRPSTLTVVRWIATAAGLGLVIAKVVPGFAARFIEAGSDPAIAWTAAVMIGIVLDAAWIGFGEGAIHGHRAKDKTLTGWFAGLAIVAVGASAAFAAVIGHTPELCWLPVVAAVLTVGAEAERSRLSDRATRKTAQAKVDAAIRAKVLELAATRAAELEEEARIIEQARKAQVRKAREVAEIEATGREERALRKAKATALRKGIWAGLAYNGAAAKWDASHPAPLVLRADVALDPAPAVGDVLQELPAPAPAPAAEPTRQEAAETPATAPAPIPPAEPQEDATEATTAPVQPVEAPARPRLVTVDSKPAGGRAAADSTAPEPEPPAKSSTDTSGTAELKLQAVAQNRHY